MLERVRGAHAVCSPIEDLALAEVFDAVLLASLLVHAGDADVRRRLLNTCVRHLAPHGCVLIQREADGSYAGPQGEAKAHPYGFIQRIVSSQPLGDGVYSVHLEYEFPDVTWTQTYLRRELTPEQFEQALAEVGLRVDSYLTADRTWVRAVPATS